MEILAYWRYKKIAGLTCEICSGFMNHRLNATSINQNLKSKSQARVETDRGRFLSADYRRICFFTTSKMNFRS